MKLRYYGERLRKGVQLLKLKIREKKFQGRLKYVLEKNSADTLIIVFSAFSPKPVYNYMHTLRDVKAADKLYILDDFGVKGSYYWYENGTVYPQELTKSLILSIIANGGGYKRIITVGSSKGGTCAIYYGLMFGADHIFAGACQYYVGNYLSDKLDILKAMMGTTDDESVRLLNRIMPEQLRKYSGVSSLVHLLYSPNENTFENHIVPLLTDLKKYRISFVEVIDNFTDHNEVGKPFSNLLRKDLRTIVYNE